MHNYLIAVNEAVPPITPIRVIRTMAPTLGSDLGDLVHYPYENYSPLTWPPPYFELNTVIQLDQSWLAGSMGGPGISYRPARRRIPVHGHHDPGRGFHLPIRSQPGSITPIVPRRPAKNPRHLQLPLQYRAQPGHQQLERLRTVLRRHRLGILPHGPARELHRRHEQHRDFQRMGEGTRNDARSRWPGDGLRWTRLERDRWQQGARGRIDARGPDLPGLDGPAVG